MDRRIIVIILSYLGLFILFIAVIIYRMILVAQKRKRVSKAIENSNNESKSILKILEPLLDSANYPPLLLFQITKEKAFEILKKNSRLKVLEEKKLFNYKYFIIYSPCIFVFKTKNIFEKDNKIKVKSFGSRLMFNSSFY